MPFVVARLEYVKLHECAGLGFVLPGRRSLAGPQSDNRIADAQRLSRFHRQRAGDAVALVEQTNLRDSLGHGRARQTWVDAERRCVATALFPDGLIALRIFGLAATSLQQQGQGERGQPPARLGGPALPHASGAQAS